MLTKLVQSETLADRAYRELKQTILKGKFLPNDLLPEETIATMLGISRTPLRRAITKLAHEGLVELETGKIARVACFSEQDLEEFFKLRAVLEVFAIEQAVRFVTVAFLKILDNICMEQKEAINNKDYYVYLLLDAKFHVLIAKQTRNNKLKEFVEQINSQLHRYLILSQTLEESAVAALSEHQKIVQFLRNRDVNLVGTVMRNHIQNVEMRSKKC